MHYAITAAPIRDRGGDLFGAGLMTLIGGIIMFFSIKWLVEFIRVLRGASSKSEGNPIERSKR